MSKEESYEGKNYRYYENKYPAMDDVVMVKVVKITEIGVYVSLLEYNGIQGFIPASELSRRRIRSIPKLIQVGKIEPSVVTRVDEEKGYVDLSKRRVAPEDTKNADKKYQEAKKVHNIAGIVSFRCNIPIEIIYEKLVWPLANHYQSAYNAFILSVSNPDILKVSDIGESVCAELIPIIAARMAPQMKKVRADVEVTCFTIHGIDAIRAAMHAAEAVGSDDMSVNISLIAPPLYVMSTMTLQEKEGIEILKKAIIEIDRVIKSFGGNIVVKNEPRVAQKQEDVELEGLMKKMEMENQEIAADDDNEEEE